MSPAEANLEEQIAGFRQVVSFRVRKALGASNPDWEDVVNEILFQVLEKVRSGQFRGESSIGTFIYTVTSRRIVDYIRAKSRVLRHAPEPSDFPDPQETLEDRERADRIAGMVRELKPKFRDVLELYYLQELSRDEVARRLGLTPRRVSERVNYALKLIRRGLS